MNANHRPFLADKLGSITEALQGLAKLSILITPQGFIDGVRHFISLGNTSKNHAAKQNCG
jgi:hypothetical protein